MSNTVNITSDSDLTKQRFENLEKYVELLTEKVEKISQPPIQPDPTAQAPIVENKEIGQLDDNTSLSSVQKRQLVTSQSVENAQSNKSIEMHNKGNSVNTPSIVSDSDSTFTKKQSTKQRIKTLKTTKVQGEKEK